MIAPVTRVLLIANIGIHMGLFFYAFFIEADPYIFNDVYRKWGLIPAEFWSGQGPWQPVTSMFLHGGFLHLLVNMIALWSLGTPIERTVGSNRFIWLYFISGLTGAATVVIFQPDLTSPTIGASGAIVGLLGALAVFYPNSQLLVFFIPMKARTAAIIFGIGSVALAFLDSKSNLSHFGHLGGLIGGLLYSKFALNLSIGRSTLETEADSPFGFASRQTKGGFGRGPSSGGARSAEADILRIMQELQNQRRQTFENRSSATHSTGHGREKEINPIHPDEEEYYDESQGSTQQPGGPGKGRLVFDPETGRFYFK